MIASSVFAALATGCFTATFAASRFERTAALLSQSFGAGVARGGA